MRKKGKNFEQKNLQSQNFRNFKLKQKIFANFAKYFKSMNILLLVFYSL